MVIFCLPTPCSCFYYHWEWQGAEWSSFGLGCMCQVSRRAKGTSSEVWGRCSHQRSPPKAPSLQQGQCKLYLLLFLEDRKIQFCLRCCNVLKQPQRDNTGRCFRRTREDRASSVPQLVCTLWTYCSTFCMDSLSLDVQKQQSSTWGTLEELS